MRTHTLLFLSVTWASARAHPRHHGHYHVGRGTPKRAPHPTGAVVYVPGPVETVIIYELNGQQISEHEVHQGIANGTLTWGEDGNLSTSISLPPAPTPSPSEEHHDPGPKLEHVTEPTQAPAPPESSSHAIAPSSTVEDYEPVPSTAPPPSDHNSLCIDCDKEFPSGDFSCDEFPRGYGATPLSHEGLGGWTGIQDPHERGAAGFDDIETIPHGTCHDGSCCTPGRFCSYNCPNPYLKMAWPKKQGATKQSVGGLYCNADGKLEMPEGSLAKTLCARGTDRCKVMVQNKLSQSVSICRTDYPGTESETLPLTVKPGETAELAVPSMAQYYHWDDKPTSAQYYINNQGVPEHDACTWSDGSSPVGNWAPLNFGAGWDDIKMNMGFMSLSQNRPTNDKDRLNFSITFEGNDTINPCKFNSSTGEYCDNKGCRRDKGCTATVRSGVLTLVFTD
ncbi:SUN-domain-containing protein [Lojkania enalia]|uniref:SUN-domain-containing protein n=1 Tax=Lojkania enalia TaxID=147567 RepID=A0A9P4NAZ3_9PLEO|nr:SUN-domain-containing protein [Didymosphaeria enalia]